MVNNKQLLQDILKVVKKIYKTLKNRNDFQTDTRQKKTKRTRKKKQFDQKQLDKLIKNISKDTKYMSLGRRQLTQKIHDENSQFPIQAIQNTINKILQLQIYKNVNKRHEKQHYNRITDPRPFWSVQVDVMDLNE